MAANAHKKGTVTPLSAIFPADEARKASQRVNDAILEKNKELDKLNHFVNDNTNLINLVQRLPDELHHNIMVPFGKAAFFPGRLIHTNELLVLLGENYFAERTAKQTVDILNRRAKTLSSQVDSLKAVIEDFKVEASFFDRTAAESVEGLVDIREDYSDDEDSGESPEEVVAAGVSEAGNGGKVGVDDDEEYVRMMSRMDELEKEEEEEEEEEDTEAHGDESHDSHDKVSCDLYENLNLQPRHKDESSLGEDMLQTFVKRSTEKDYAQPVVKRSVRFESDSSSEKFVDRSAEKDYVQPVVKKSVRFESDSNSEARVPAPKPDASNRLSRPNTDSLKAFTGSIIERTDNLLIDPDKETNNQSPNPQPSKPVSRFKQRRAAQN